jgi:hypothetical protein
MKSSFVYHQFWERDKHLNAAQVNRDNVMIHLKYMRISRDVSMRELAKACGFASEAHICDLEKGKRNWTEEAAMKAEEFLRLYA